MGLSSSIADLEGVYLNVVMFCLRDVNSIQGTFSLPLGDLTSFQLLVKAASPSTLLLFLSFRYLFIISIISDQFAICAGEYANVPN